MEFVTCQSCGGTFAPILADGTQYFHRCAPLSRAELAAAVAAGKVQLPAKETSDDAIGRRTYERANLRDENLQGTRGAAAKAIKAAGAGVVAVAPPAAPPQTIVDMSGVDVQG